MNTLPNSFGATGNFKTTSGTGPVVNNYDFANQISTIADEIFGENSSIKVDPISVADDMSEFMNLAPSVYALLGGKKKVQKCITIQNLILMNNVYLTE